MKDKAIMTVLSTAMAGAMAYISNLLIPIIVLACFMVLDYFTGMASAWINKQLNSRIGIRGILKKISYLCVVCVAIGADYLIHSSLLQIGISYSLTYLLGMIVTIWITINEMISILENIAKITGENAPAFLTAILGKLKSTIENKTGGDE